MDEDELQEEVRENDGGEETPDSEERSDSSTSSRSPIEDIREAFDIIQRSEIQPDTIIMPMPSDTAGAWDLRQPVSSDTVPAFTFNSDPDTGIGRSSGERLSFGNGNTGFHESLEDSMALSVVNQEEQTFGIKSNGALMIRDQDTGKMVQITYSSKKGGFITVKDNKLVEVINEKEEKQVSKWEAIIGEVNGWEDSVSDD